MEDYRISQEDLEEYFNGKREISIDEYYNYIKWKKENKKRGA